MAKTKTELLAEAKKLKLEVTAKNTIAEITAAIEAAGAEVPVVETKEAKITKAGKHSEKGLKEAEEKTAKIEAQKHRDDAEAEEAAKPKAPIKPARSRLERKSKGYQKLAVSIDKTKTYGLTEAINLAIKTSPVKFDASLELHINLGIDPRHADQNLRDTIVLPAGTGKTIRVAVFADVDDAAAAKKAGADIAAGEEFLQQLEKGTVDFDILIVTPAQMPKLGKYARLLGPKGLMPNPKSGTVTTDVTKAVAQAKAGRLEYRVDSTGIVHVAAGKLSFGTDKLAQNVRAVFTSIRSNKPASVKGNYVKAIYLATTMGPSIKVDVSEI